MADLDQHYSLKAILMEGQILSMDRVLIPMEDQAQVKLKMAIAMEGLDHPGVLAVLQVQDQDPHLEITSMEGQDLCMDQVFITVSYTHLTLPTIYSV